MKLSTATVQMYRNFVDPQRINVEGDVTCLVGKNESGKTTILRALHRLNPANGLDASFDLTTEYPRWRLAPDRQEDPDLGQLAPISAEFTLESDDLVALGEVFEVPPPAPTLVVVSRTYDGEILVELSCELIDAIAEAASAVALPDGDLEAIRSYSTLAEVIAGGKALAKEHREQGDAGPARAVTSFLNLLEKYEPYLDGTELTEEQDAAIESRIPKFFYFSNYDTLPGDIDLNALAAKITSRTALNPRERTVVALLKHAGKQPADFLEDNYDSRKAELQAAGSSLGRQVFKYWKQNPDLAVVFDTDNRLELDPSTNTQSAHRYLKIELRDGRHGDVETNFNTRSTGFQWFFSFFAAFSEYQRSKNSVVVLLDEPGTSLHGDAQREFVNYIYNELGSSKQTIYTTHSQHMVDPTRYEKLRAVHDRATRENPDLGVVVTLPNLSADPATILPIESALGYSVSQHLFIGSGQHLAVEGSSDFVFIQRMTEHLVSKGRTGLDPRLAILPVGGADNMPALVALLGRRLKVSALVDGARSGNRIARLKAAAKDNGVPESAIVVCSDVAGTPTNADIEDCFDPKDYLKLYNWAFFSNVQVSELAATAEPIIKRVSALRGAEYDHALPAHALTSHREEFFGSITARSVDKFEELFIILNSTVHS